MSRLIHSTSRHFSISRLYMMAAARNGRFLSTGSETRLMNPSKLWKERRAVHPHLHQKSNGFVGSHVCKEALDRGLSVASLSRSGRSSINESWVGSVIWHQGSLLSDNSWKEALNGVTAVISCIGGFGSNSYMHKINKTANINAIKGTSKQGVILRPRFIYGTVLEA